MEHGHRDTVAYALGEFVRGTGFGDFDDGTVWRAKMCILDMLGVITAAWPEESTQILFRWLKGYGSEPESSVLGSGLKLPAANAVMLNSMMAHSLELEDHHSHKRSLNHPGVCTIPAALAIAERDGRSGSDFLTAVVLGYEIGSRLSAATRLGTLNLQRGFHESSVIGPFSAATAAGKLAGLGADVLARAYGICGGLAAGSMEFKSSEAWSKRLQVGNAGRCGVMAAELAAGGFTGPPTVFEGKHGFFHSYVHEGNYDLSGVADGLGRSWDINFIQYKPFACAGVLHSAVTAAAAARERHGLDPERVARVEVRTAARLIEEYAEPAGRKAAPENSVGAQFSLQYAVAVMLVRGRALLAEFSPQVIADPLVLRVAKRVVPVADAAIGAGWPGDDPTELAVATDDGARYVVRVEQAKGDLNDPVTDAELDAKFRELTAPYLSPARQEAVIGACRNLEGVSDMRAFAALLAPDR
jgi:2-methylcitrate dehydratase PrpD